MKGQWSATQYLQFASLRDRPFFELVGRISRIDSQPVGRVVDLGCGAGQLTRTLLHRFPSAQVLGVDSSADMLQKARLVDGKERHLYSEDDLKRIRFEQGDLEHTVESADVVISNAALHWLPVSRQEALIRKWHQTLPPGGSFAFQVPGNYVAPSHQLLAQLRRSPRWSNLVSEGADLQAQVKTAEEYARQMLADGWQSVDAWETTYIQVLQGSSSSLHPLLEWLKGTTLVPVLSKLADNPTLRDAFLLEYKGLLDEAYPSDTKGLTLFPFRRVFVVARK